MIKITVTGTIHLDMDDFVRIATDRLGMQMPADVASPSLDPFEAIATADPDIASAIDAVVRASAKHDKDRFTGGEQAALYGLVRAANRLRIAMRTQKSNGTQKRKKRHENSNA